MQACAVAQALGARGGQCIPSKAADLPGPCRPVKSRKPSGHGLDSGAIAGIAVGSVAAVGLAAGLVLLLVRRRAGSDVQPSGDAMTSELGRWALLAVLATLLVELALQMDLVCECLDATFVSVGRGDGLTVSGTPCGLYKHTVTSSALRCPAFWHMQGLGRSSSQMTEA